jgi:hypothetical protein
MVHWAFNEVERGLVSIHDAPEVPLVTSTAVPNLRTSSSLCDTCLYVQVPGATAIDRLILEDLWHEKRVLKRAAAKNGGQSQLQSQVCDYSFFKSHDRTMSP